VGGRPRGPPTLPALEHGAFSLVVLLQDMFFDQKKQIQNLTAKLEQAMRDNKDYEEKTSQLQRVGSLTPPSSVAPHSTLTLVYRCGYLARFHLGSPWRLFCGVPTASHPHPWLVSYLDGTDACAFCLFVVFPYVP